MTAEVATTSGFVGADVDGLDHLSQEFAGAAEIVDMVKTACEVIVAAASIFGPFGAAFVAYLKGTVIPWLTKVSAALKAMSKVLATHSSAQKDASSNATSLPSYQGTTNLPTTSTQDAPRLPAAAPTTSAIPAPAPAAGTGSTVATPATIGGSTSTKSPAATTSPTTSGAGSGATPFVQAVTALTGLVTAVDHLVHPGASAAATGSATTPTPAAGTSGSIAPVLSTGSGSIGGTGGIELGGLTPLHPGDTVGVLSVPVDVAPDGTITPLGHGSLDAPAAPTTTPTTTAVTTPVTTPVTGAPQTPPTHAVLAAAHPEPQAAAPIGSSGSGSGPAGTGASPSSGGVPSGGVPSGGVPGGVPTGTAPADAVTTAAHVAAPSGAHAAPGLRTHTIGSHDGLFTGLGQATGIGAGAAALARAVLSEARQHGDGTVLGAAPLPFEADADLPVRTEIFQGSIG